MKTSLLNQLSKEITQGEWCVKQERGHSFVHSRDGIVAGCYDAINSKLWVSESLKNGAAISLTPQLIREVLELREALKACELAMMNARKVAAEKDKNCGDTFRSFTTDVFPCNRAIVYSTQDALDAARSILTRHETNNQ